MPLSPAPASPLILVVRRHGQYDDAPGRHYHYPVRRYDSLVREARGEVVLIYEPRRGGAGAGTHAGGRMAFVAWAVLGGVSTDSTDVGRAYVAFDEYHEFPTAVPAAAVGLSTKQLQAGVTRTRPDVVEQVLQLALAPLVAARPAHDGLVDLSLPMDWQQRPMRQVVREEVVRDRAFRYRVIEQAYDGRCAMTGLRLTNGFGRAEVDAAHIIPVARGGPDVVTNGLALTKTVHWAFDRGLVSASDDHRILVVERGLPDDLHRLLRPDRTLLAPASDEFAPHPQFLQWHRRHIFKGSDATTE